MIGDVFGFGGGLLLFFTDSLLFSIVSANRGGSFHHINYLLYLLISLLLRLLLLIEVIDNERYPDCTKKCQRDLMLFDEFHDS